MCMLYAEMKPSDKKGTLLNNNPLCDNVDP